MFLNDLQSLQSCPVKHEIIVTVYNCDGVDISSNKYLYQRLDFHLFLFKIV